jgi:proteasome accessory factor B
VVSEDRAQVDSDLWLQAAEAADQRSVVHVRYRRFDGVEKDYCLRVVHLVAYHGDWYLAGFRLDREGPSLFALSRVHAIEPGEATIPVPEDWSPTAFFREAFGISHGEEAFEVRLRCSPKVASYMESRVWHPDQRMERLDDGSLDLSFTTHGWKELVRWVLSWQPDVQVLAPDRLRERVAEKMRQGIARMQER